MFLGPVRKYALLTLFLWLFTVGGSLWWNMVHMKGDAVRLAVLEARGSVEKDILFRAWNSRHGRVYVPVTSETLPNPYLKVPERDIVTPSGLKLTMVNPAYMTRQVYTLAEKRFGIYGHITSLNPVNPVNKPDSWEVKALKAIELGKTEYWSVVTFKGGPYLRYMKGLFVERSCLRCHGKQGYKVGDLRGGISVYIPLSPIMASFSMQKKRLIISHVAVALLGSFLILFLFHRIALREERLRESEEKYRNLFEKSAAGIFRVTPDGKIMDANPRFASILGYESAEELKSIPAIKLYPNPEDRKMLTGEIERAGKVEGYRVWLKRKDGRPVCISVYGAVERDESGKSLYYHGTVLDVTEEEETKRALENLEARYKAIFDRIPVGMFRLNSSGSIVLANPAMVDILGADRLEDVIGVNLLNLVEADGDEEKDIREELAEKGSISGFERRLKKLDGSHAWVRLYISEIADDGYGYEGMCEDVTKERELEEQVRQAQKMEAVGTLVEGVAHDFNNILTGIQGNIELAMLSLEKGSKPYERLEHAQNGIKRATDIVRKLMAFGKRQPLKKEKLNPNDFIKDFSVFIREVLLKENIELKFEFDDKATCIEADPTALGQILLNLVTNSMDAMPGGGTITIGTEYVEVGDGFSESYSWVKARPLVCIFVSDTGCGMPPEVKERIFEPFFTTKRPGKGTGLGLSVVYGLVKEHDGVVSVESEVGKGTTFRIYIPSCSVEEKEPEIHF